MSQIELTQITDPKSVFDAGEPKFTFVKPDLKPGEKKYYEITAEQVTADYLATKGNKVVSKEQPDGQIVDVTDWVLTRTGADGETQQWTMWDETNEKVATGVAFFQQRWKPVDGKPGYYSPRSVPTPMVELPEGGKLKVSWGEVEGGPGSFLAKYGEGDYNIITAKDVSETYDATDEASEKKLAEIRIALIEI